MHLKKSEVDLVISILLAGIMAIATYYVFSNLNTYPLENTNAFFKGIVFIFHIPYIITFHALASLQWNEVVEFVAYGAPFVAPFLAFLWWGVIFFFFSYVIGKSGIRSQLIRHAPSALFVIILLCPLPYFYSDAYFMQSALSGSMNDDVTAKMNGIPVNIPIDAHVYVPQFLEHKLWEEESVDVVIDMCMALPDEEEESCIYHLGFIIDVSAESQLAFMQAYDPDAIYPKRGVEIPEAVIPMAKLAVCDAYRKRTQSEEKEQQCLLRFTAFPIHPDAFDARICLAIKTPTADCAFMDTLSTEDKRKFLQNFHPKHLPTTTEIKIEAKQPFNLLHFDVDFAGVPSSDGVARIYLDTRLIETVFERQWGDELLPFRNRAFQTLPAGTHTIRMQVDSLDEYVASSAELTNVTIEYNSNIRAAD